MGFARLDLVIGTKLDFLIEEKNEEGEEKQINDREQNERSQHGIRLDGLGKGIRGPQQPVNNPWLTPHFG
jgi:hypothetical protein